ncbi:unnamed protein product [Paramecium sonneborni]|uniref:Uncharacterized protein n=1 Tax=Paramecium sonneborni TaxID=65129 RepID=A0A8S1R3T7_9CILI|nr:unnamed protein product [Paramecium sonneborni]
MQIEQSIFFDEFNSQELLEISKCISAIPDLIDINLTFLNISQFTYSAQLQNQIATNIKFENSSHLTESQKNLEVVIMQQLTVQAKLQNNLHFGLFLTNKQSESLKSMQTDKSKQIINCSRNSQIGIQFKKSDGLLSNQIFNSRIQSAFLTTPLSVRNSIYMGQSEVLLTNDQINQQSHQQNKYRWIHQIPFNITQKRQQTTQTQNKSKPRYFVQDYSQLNQNPYTDPKQINKQFQITGWLSSKIKQHNSNSIDDQNQKLQQNQITNQNSGFKLIIKQQKIQSNNNQSKEGHIIITLPKSKKKFDSFSSKQKKHSNSVDQININRHFKRLLQTSEPRELYAKPFFYSQYSKISKITVSSSPESLISNLYKPNKKQKRKFQNYSNTDDYLQQQYYSDDSFEGKSQKINKVDLYQLSQVRQNSLRNTYEQSNFNFTSSKKNNLNSYKHIQNEYQESPNQNFQSYQKAVDSKSIFQNSDNVEEQNRNSNMQEYSNFHYFQDNQTESLIHYNPFSSKEPIQIKLNIKQFITSEQQINQSQNSPMACNFQ